MRVLVSARHLSGPGWPMVVQRPQPSSTPLVFFNSLLLQYMSCCLHLEAMRAYGPNRFLSNKAFAAAVGERFFVLKFVTV